MRAAPLGGEACAHTRAALAATALAAVPPRLRRASDAAAQAQQQQAWKWARGRAEPLELAQLVREGASLGAPARSHAPARRWRWPQRTPSASTWTKRCSSTSPPRAFSRPPQLLLRRAARVAAQTSRLPAVAESELVEAVAALATRGGDVSRAAAELERRVKRRRDAGAGAAGRLRLAALLAYAQWCGVAAGRLGCVV